MASCRVGGSRGLALQGAQGAAAALRGQLQQGAYGPIGYCATYSWFAADAGPGADARRQTRAEYWQDAANSCTMIKMLLEAGHPPDFTGDGGETALQVGGTVL